MDGKRYHKISTTSSCTVLEVIEDILLNYYSRHCDEALEELESIDDDAEKFSVDFVKINDKRLAKSHGVKKFPALTFFQVKNR